MGLSIKLIVTDFDGTIFNEYDSPPIPAELQEKIEEMRSCGCKWAINTGRDLLELLEGLSHSKIGIGPDFLVTVEREIYAKNGDSYKPVEDWNRRCDKMHKELFKRVKPFLPELHRYVNDRFKATIYADGFSPFCIIAENNLVMDEICRYLSEFCAKVPGLAVMRNDVYARFCHKDYNKGTTTAEISRILGLKSDSIFAAGDHINDLPMLDRNVANYIAAPSNSVDLVKKHIIQQKGYVSFKPGGLGVLEALNYFLNK
ncbi:MAG: HAD family hydrolase [Limisphaerales bacterium]